MFPRASWSNLATTSPLVVMGIQNTGGSITTAATPATLGDGNSGNFLLAIDNYGFNGTAYDRIRTNSAAILSSAVQSVMMGVASPGEWALTSNPGANLQATVTKAAGGAGVRHICRAILLTLISTAAAATGVQWNLRDGASGAGTILWSGEMAIPATADSFAVIQLSGLNIFGSANTAMTLEFGGAGGASTLETVALSGYDTV